MRTKREYTPLPMFAELDITSNFTFLTGGSHPEEYMERAALLGLPAIAIADENSVAGIVRAHTHAREIARQVKLRAEAEAMGPIGPPLPEGWSPKRPFDDYPGSSQRRKHPIARFETIPDRPAPSAAIRTAPRLIPAARIVLRDGFTATALPRDRAAWGRLCRLISTGRLRADKGTCDLRMDDLVEWGEGMELLLHPPRTGLKDWTPQAKRLVHRFPAACHLLLAPRYDGQDRARFDRLASLAADLRIATVAAASPLLHHGRAAAWPMC